MRGGVFEYIVLNHLTVTLRRKFKQVFFETCANTFIRIVFCCFFRLLVVLLLFCEETHNAMLLKFYDLVQILLAFRTIILEYV